MKTITIIGSGYVGTTFAAILSNLGYKVFALDINPKIIETLKLGKSHFFEEGLDEFVKKGIESKNLIPTTSYEESIPNSDIIFSCVGTPDNPDGSSNLSYIFDSAQTASKFAKQNVIYVQKSTVPVGTGKKVIAKMKESNPNLKFDYLSNPEFLREGSAIYDTFLSDRVVIGGEDKNAISEMMQIYKKIAEFSLNLDLSKYSSFANIFSSQKGSIQEIFNKIKYLSTSIESAELIKVTSNAFLALKISFANSIAKLADASDADINEVMDGVGSDNRIGRSFLYAGLGWGGGCFPKDVSGLISISEEFGVDQSVMESAVTENSSMIDFVIRKLIQKYSNNLSAKKVTVLGMAFKSGTSDCRKSPAVFLIKRLESMGVQVTAFDPKAGIEAKEHLDPKTKIADSIEDAISGSDLVIIATEWPQFKEFDWSKAKIKDNFIFDTRNILDKEKIKEFGFEYLGIGRK